jgi:hypothetical protein
MEPVAVTQFDEGRIPLRISYFEFCRKFADGSELNTNNLSLPRVLARHPSRLEFRCPGFDSAQQLWELHQKLVGKEKKFSQPCLSPEGTEIEAFCADYGDQVETQARMGYLARDGSTHNYRPTWKGAFLMTWRLCWPVKNILVALNRARTRRLLRELHSRQ